MLIEEVPTEIFIQPIPSHNRGETVLGKNIARIAKLPKIMSEIKKMSFLSGREVR